MNKFKANNLLFFNKYPHGYLLKENSQQLENSALLLNNQTAIIELRSNAKIEFEKKSLILNLLKLKDEVLQNTYKNYPQLNNLCLNNKNFFNSLKFFALFDKSKRKEQNAIILLKKTKNGFYARYKGFFGFILFSTIYSNLRQKKKKKLKNI